VDLSNNIVIVTTVQTIKKTVTETEHSEELKKHSQEVTLYSVLRAYSAIYSLLSSVVY